jgi:hypothetical protein
MTMDLTATEAAAAAAAAAPQGFGSFWTAGPGRSISSEHGGAPSLPSQTFAHTRTQTHPMPLAPLQGCPPEGVCDVCSDAAARPAGPLPAHRCAADQHHAAAAGAAAAAAAGPGLPAGTRGSAAAGLQPAAASGLCRGAEERVHLCRGVCVWVLGGGECEGMCACLSAMCGLCKALHSLHCTA